MTTTAQKWGNSLGVRIPKKIANQYQMDSGTRVEFEPEKDGIFLKVKSKRPTLDELISNCEGSNPNPELFSDSVGREML